MPIHNDQKLTLKVALNLKELTNRIMKLESKNFYVDPGVWESLHDSFNSISEDKKFKKFVLWSEEEENEAFEVKYLAVGFGSTKKATLEETGKIGKEVFNFLTTEGFKVDWDEDPDSFLMVNMDQDLDDPDDPAELTADLEIKDTPELREKYRLKHSINPCFDDEVENRIEIYIHLEDGESVVDAIERLKITRKDILRYRINIETETDSENLSSIWSFDDNLSWDL